MFADRVLPFDSAAARKYAEIAALGGGRAKCQLYITFCNAEFTNQPTPHTRGAPYSSPSNRK